MSQGKENLENSSSHAKAVHDRTLSYKIHIKSHQSFVVNPFSNPEPIIACLDCSLKFIYKFLTSD